jgi:uncharacterized protein YecE (DUF72 family)
MAPVAQLPLFGGSGPDPAGPSPIVTAAQRELAKKLPGHLHLGTSSFTFSGWCDLLYAGRWSKDALVERGLAAYAQHPLLRTVGIDRTYWAPMTTAQWAEYRAQVPAGFVAITKAWSDLTTAFFPDHPRYGERAGLANARFLDPQLAMEGVVRPYLEGMREHAGPLVLELAPIPDRLLPDPRELFARLGELLASFPRELPVAIELRTPRLFTPRYVELLARHRATHVVSYWSDMPRPAEQARHIEHLDGDLVLRLLQPPGSSYEALQQKYEPFDRLHAIDESLRDEAEAITRRALARGRRVFLVLGNLVEGCAPLTLFALAERLAS